MMKMMFMALLSLAAITAGGCADLSQLASGTIEPPYKGLAGQNCAILVWADQGTLVEHDTVLIDTASRIEMDLLDAESHKMKEFAGARWIPASAITRYQDDHQEINGEAMVDVIGKLKLPEQVTRLIYVEIDKLNLHPENSPEMYRGEMEGTLRVIEFKDGKAKVAYEEIQVSTTFPDHVPDSGYAEEGGLNDQNMYEGTLDSFATEVTLRFMPHEEK